ncbi:hypothetical protein BC937DRAFT_92607 [Endogone sp. FLAS-F59071]|nr:hypothetical protein BC937DRAFT_92607 [Endogone sp. FLAS-F59071]|eukprot:RUS21472.1 hypothetical protein BC937DRAFT_92607 [Endogone sp. FLAS-F59071]
MSSRTAKILENITTGLGATKLNPSVRRVSLIYAIQGKTECMGAKYFYRENLPRVKYANPEVEFVVNKSKDATITPTLTIEFALQSALTRHSLDCYSGRDQKSIGGSADAV